MKNENPSESIIILGRGQGLAHPKWHNFDFVEEGEALKLRPGHDQKWRTQEKYSCMVRQWWWKRTKWTFFMSCLIKISLSLSQL